MVALLLAILTANPSPSPTPLLKTIITVKSSPFCGALAAHANAAIGSAVDNDRTLGTAIVDLRSNDLSINTIHRQQEMRRLGDLADAAYRQYRAGENEVKQMRDLAAKTSDPQEKAELKAAADALGGALYRQHLVQRDLDGFLAFLSASDARSSGDDIATPDPNPVGVNRPDPTSPSGTAYWVPQGFLRQPLLLAGNESPDDDQRMAAAAAEDFQQRMPAIFQDELNAAPHIETAGDNC